MKAIETTATLSENGQLTLSRASKIAGIVSFNLMRSPDLVGQVEG